MPSSSRKTAPPKASTSRQIDTQSEDSTSDSENESKKRKSKTQSQPGKPAVNIQLLTTNLVKYILNHSCNKIPVKRSDAVKHLNIPRKEQNKIFHYARDKLRDIYGLELLEVPETKSSKLFIVLSSIPIASSLQYPPDEAKDIQLLFIVLSYIFMKSVDVPEDNLLNFIEQLRIDPDDFVKSRDTFVRQLYLKRQKIEIEGRSEPHFTISWGERAKLEFDKKKMLAAVSQLMGKAPQSFVNQYHEAHGEEADVSKMQESMDVD